MPATDLRIQKTQRQIEQAFLSLLQQKNYRSITVQDILDTAMINRSTFYRHYTSKAALASNLVAGFRQQYEAYLQKRFAQTTDDLLIFVNDFLLFLTTQKHKILSLWQIKTSSLNLYEDMYKLVKAQYIRYATSQLANPLPTFSQGTFSQGTFSQGSLSQDSFSPTNSPHIPANFDYQGHIYASLVLAHLHYLLNHNIAFNIHQTRQQLLQIFTLTGIGL